MKVVKKIILLVLLIILVGIGASISLKAAIGIGAWDALAQNLSNISGIKIGTIGMILNISCFLGQILILRKNFRVIQLLQIPLNIILGTVVNFILYNVLGGIVIDGYIARVLLLILSYCISAFSVGAVMVLNLVTFSLEGLCSAISEKIGFEFSKLRQGVDILSVILCLLLSFMFKVDLAVREGTIIGMLLFGPLIGLSMKIVKPIFIKYNIIEELKAYEEVEEVNITVEIG